MSSTRCRGGLRTSGVVLPLLISLSFAASQGRCQDGVNEQRASGGNNATIVVNVRNNAGDPLPVAAIVKLFRNGTIPNGQTTTQGGRAILLPQNLGDF